MKTSEQTRNIFRLSILRLKGTPRETLTTAVLLLAGLYITSFIPVLGAFLFSLILVLVFAAQQKHLEGKDRGLLGLLKAMSSCLSVPHITLALFIAPATLMLGSIQALAMSSLFGPSLILLLTVSLLFLDLFLISALLSTLPKLTHGKSVFRSIDSSLKKAFSHWRLFGLVTFGNALAILIGIIPIGLGLLVTLPLFVLSIAQLTKEPTLQ